MSLPFTTTRDHRPQNPNWNWFIQASGISLFVSGVAYSIAPPECQVEFAAAGAGITMGSMMATGALALARHAQDPHMTLTESASEKWRRRQRTGMIAGLILSAGIMTYKVLDRFAGQGKDFCDTKTEIMKPLPRDSATTLIDMNCLHPE